LIAVRQAIKSCRNTTFAKKSKKERDPKIISETTTATPLSGTFFKLHIEGKQLLDYVSTFGKKILMRKKI
jgi:hypothetical protein